MAVLAFTRGDRALVTAAPTFEEPADVAAVVGAPVRAVRVDGALRLDLAAMADQARGAGLVFLCNPNNPTSTVHPAADVRDFVTRAHRASPEAVVLVDEAYHEFVEDAGYATAIPLALADPRVVVARTFSKIHGLAGLRVGYAVGAAPTIAAMRRHRLGLGVSGLAAAAALAALGQRTFVRRQQALNREARAFTQRFLADRGHAVASSETNFLFVDLRRDSRAFQDACAKRGVLVGRPFPPLTTHARVSIGTMAEMRRAVAVFRDVLAT
jgi:histidinol-phosphate aminotransferase